MTVLKGWVIFESEAAFNIAHEEAKAMARLPKIGNVDGVPAPQNTQTINITYCIPHPTDGTVVSPINGGWDNSLKGDLTFLTKEEVSGYFPE